MRVRGIFCWQNVLCGTLIIFPETFSQCKAKDVSTIKFNELGIHSRSTDFGWN